nr:MAG TPA: hypothetical protein [Caudoviricetes sp.]
MQIFNSQHIAISQDLNGLFNRIFATHVLCKPGTKDLTSESEAYVQNELKRRNMTSNVTRLIYVHETPDICKDLQLKFNATLKPWYVSGNRSEPGGYSDMFIKHDPVSLVKHIYESLMQR